VYLSIVTGIVTLAFFFILGQISDKISPRIMTPVSYFCRAFSLFSLMLINQPISMLSFILWSFVSISGLTVSVGIDSYFAKNLPKEIRGVLLSCMAFMSLMGTSLSIKIGGKLFDSYGRNAPFNMIGLCDLTFCAFSIVMIMAGHYGQEKSKNKDETSELKDSDDFRNHSTIN
jgi:predicted MFS family arabinose efflux permease